MKGIVNSCLYYAKVAHVRSEPIHRRFDYRLFMFYLDLSELETIKKKIKLIGYNSFNYFSFRDKDHLRLPKEKPDTKKPVREHLINYLAQNEVQEPIGRIMLLTNLTTLGYQFNPVSFYFVYDVNDKPLCSVVEVGNTFKEMKPYFIDGVHLEKDIFTYRTKKLFYVSPFIAHDVDFNFQLSLPSEKLNLRIDDYKGDNHFFTALLSGEKKALTNSNVVRYALLFPLITLRVIGLIYWQAMKIWLKKIPFYKKEEYPELQVDVYNRNKITP